MRRHDKKKHMAKVNMLTEQRQNTKRGCIIENGFVREDEEFHIDTEGLDAEDIAYEKKNLMKAKKQAQKLVTGINILLPKAVDAFGDPMEIKLWADSTDKEEVQSVEMNGNEIRITVGGFRPETYTENISQYGYRDAIYFLKRIFMQLKKTVDNKETSDLYDFYLVDMDSKHVMDGFRTKDDALAEKDMNRDMNVAVLSKRQLLQIGLKPIEVGVGQVESKNNY